MSDRTALPRYTHASFGKKTRAVGWLNRRVSTGLGADFSDDSSWQVISFARSRWQPSVSCRPPICQYVTAKVYNSHVNTAMKLCITMYHIPAVAFNIDQAKQLWNVGNLRESLSAVLRICRRTLSVDILWLVRLLTVSPWWQAAIFQRTLCINKLLCWIVRFSCQQTLYTSHMGTMRHVRRTAIWTLGHKSKKQQQQQQRQLARTNKQTSRQTNIPEWQ